MKNLKYKIIFIIIMLTFVPVIINAKNSNYDCTYGDGITIEFGEGGAKDVDVDPKSSVYPDKLEESYLVKYNITYDKKDYTLTKHLTNQLGELYGMCPEKIYFCSLEVLTFYPGVVEEFLELFPDNFTFESVLSLIIGRPIYEVDLFALATKKEAEQNSKLTDYDDGISGGNKWLDGFVEILTNICEGEFADAAKAYWEAVKNYITFESQEIYISSKSCDNYEYNGDRPTYNLACPNINIYYGRYSTALNEYTACGDNRKCKADKMTYLNDTETQAKKYCQNILQNYDYDEGTEQDCLETCITVSNTFMKLKESAGLTSSSTGKCGFSARLLVWLSNILRWIKYILPVAVIVLSILEFIKAIGADKEDEMKKAQKKFITRLISAALVFIIPLLIEFILDKMGFGYNDCGLF